MLDNTCKRRFLFGERLLMENTGSKVVVGAQRTLEGPTV
jgi:hypothetical protein